MWFQLRIVQCLVTVTLCMRHARALLIGFLVRPRFECCLPLTVAPPQPSPWRLHDNAASIRPSPCWVRPSPWRLLVAMVPSVEGLPDEQRLILRLLGNYDPAARPVYNASHTVTVKFGYTLTQIADMVRHRYVTRMADWCPALHTLADDDGTW